MRTLPAWVPLLVFAAAWLAHGSALGADWVGDDAALVRDSAVVARGPSAAAAAFGRDAWSGETERGAWRPLTVYSFCVESPLWRAGAGEAPSAFGYHLTNLFLHGIAALLLLLLGRSLLPDRPALVVGTALVFAVHPLHAQAVATLVGRADLLALVFSLLAAWLWIEAARGRPALLPLSALSFFLALLSKETAVGLPLALLLVEASARGRPGAPRRGRGRLLAYGVLLVPVALWALRWTWFVPDLRAGVDGLGAATTWFFVPVGFTRDLYASTAAFTDLTISPLALGVGAAAWIGGIAALLGWIRRGPIAFALATTALLWSAAVLVSPAGLPLLPRFAYVPAVGLSVAGGALLRVLWLRPRARAVGLSAVTVLLVALGAITWSEGRALADTAAFDRALLDTYPESDELLLRAARKLRVEAVDERLRSATRVLGEEERDALVERTSSRLADARSYVQAVLRRSDPGDLASEKIADAWRELGFILQNQARTPESVEVLRKALRKEPWLLDDARRLEMPPARRLRVVETLRRLARSEEAVGEVREAAIHMEHAAELVPGDVEVLYAAGRTLSRAGEHTRARARLQAARELAADPELRDLIERDLEAAQETARRMADARLQAARQAIEDGRHGEAVIAFEEALGADPTLLRAYLELALHLGQWFGRYPQAYEVIAAGERMLGEIGYPPQDPWWGRLRDLKALLQKLEREDREEEERED